MTDFTADIQAFIRRHGHTHLTPRAALFDMDGTLYDSMPRHARAWMNMCAEEGLNAHYDEFFAFEGRTGADTINILFNRQYGHDASPEDVKRLYGRKTELFAAQPAPPVIEGADAVTRYCRDAAMTTVLVTGSGQSSLLNRLDADFPGVFDAERRVTSHDVTHGKPHPEPYLRALQIAGVDATDAITFENAPLGVRSSDAAGVFTIAVITGPIPRRDMEQAGAAVVFDSMAQCAEMLPRLLSQLKVTTLQPTILTHNRT